LARSASTHSPTRYQRRGRNKADAKGIWLA
jgi:hypothetical protein